MPDDNEDIEIKAFLDTLYENYDHDFRRYAPKATRWLLEQDLKKFGVETIAGLKEKLLLEPGIVPRVIESILIQFSELFRDPSYFRAIRERMVPELQKCGSIKVWIAGCSEGQELYSLAILFREAGLEERTSFYATDIQQNVLNEAQAGRYIASRLTRFTENYEKSGGTGSLADYYTLVDGQAVFDPTLRQQVTFLRHDLARDAALANMTLVSCRNVLIYFDRALQNRAVGLFKESLIDDGFLGLGAVETLRPTMYAQDFTGFVPDEKIYRKCATAE